MKNYQMIWHDTAEGLELAVNKHLAENPHAFCLGGPVAVAVGGPPSPHSQAHSGWYQAVAENN